MKIYKKNYKFIFLDKRHLEKIIFRIPITIFQLTLTLINIRILFEKLGSDLYGKFATVFAGANLLAPILSFGFTTMLLNYASKLDSKFNLRKITELLWKVSFIQGVILLTVSVLFSENLLSLDLSISIGLATLICLNSLIWSVIAAHGWWKVSQFQFIIVSSIFTLLLYNSIDELSFVKIIFFQMLSILVSLIFGITIFVRLRNSLNSKSGEELLNGSEPKVQLGYPFGLSVIYTLATQLDIQIVARALNFNEAARYQLALQLFQPLSSILFAVVFSTRSLYRRLSNRKIIHTYLEIQVSFLKIGVLLFSFNIFLAILAFPIVSDDNVTLSIISLLLFGVNGLIGTLAYSASLLFSDFGDMPWVFRLEAACLLFINLPISLIGTFLFGFIGPIIGTLVSNLVRIYMFNRAGRRKFDV